MIKKKKILLLGAYGQDNLGDDLLLRLFLDNLHGYNVVVNSANPENTASEFDVAAVSTNGKSFVSMLKALIRTDVVVFGGGSLLKELNRNVGRWKYSVLFNTFMGVVMAKALCKTVILSAIGTGKLKTGISRLLARLSVQLADMVTLRDSDSKRLLENIGVKKELHLVADPVFTLQSGQCRDNGEQTPLIAIAPAYNVEDGASYKQIARHLSEMADYLIDTYKARVVLLPFQTAFNPNNDVVAGQYIINKMRNKDKVTQMVGKVDMQDICALYNSVDLLVGMRFHSVLIAALHRVPVLAVSYDVKVQSLMNELGLQEFSLGLGETDAERLINRLEALMKGKKDVERIMDESVPVMVDRADLNFKLLKQVLENKEEIARISDISSKLNPIER